jgi:hypothetical protein
MLLTCRSSEEPRDRGNRRRRRSGTAGCSRSGGARKERRTRRERKNTAEMAARSRQRWRWRRRAGAIYSAFVIDLCFMLEIEFGEPVSGARKEKKVSVSGL